LNPGLRGHAVKEFRSGQHAEGDHGSSDGDAGEAQLAMKIDAAR
jgi:hypothetical protein